MPVPSSVVRKIERAAVHLVALRDAQELFMEADPYGTVHRVHDDGRRHVFHLKVKASPPPDIAVIAGDVLTNARAALDHLVFAAGLASGLDPTSKKARRYTFPITNRESDFTDAVKKMPALSPELVARLRSMQKFGLGGRPHRNERFLLLYSLRDLVNIDKHRELTIVGVGWWTLRATPEAAETRTGSWPLVDGSQLAELRFAEPKRQDEVEMHPDLYPVLETRSAKDWWTGQPPVDLLRGILDVIVNSVLPAFDPLM